MQNPPLQFRQSSITFKNPGYFSGKFWWAPTTIRVWYFLLKFCTTFLLTNVYKRVFRIFLFCLDLELLINLVSVGVFILTNNSGSKQNQTNLEHPFEHIGKRETCITFQQNLLNSMVVGAQFFRQNNLFLKNNRALSKFLCGILHYLISITKLSKKQFM